MQIPRIYLMAMVAVMVIVAGYAILMNVPGRYDSFARCVSASGAKMYGSFQCPHCSDQKRMFGNSWRLIDYVECSTPDGKAQAEACALAGIRSYPTWVFKDGNKSIGITPFEAIAEKTGCSLNG
jgi:hypothetical protein